MLRQFALFGALWLLCVAAGAGIVGRGQSQARDGLFDRFEPARQREPASSLPYSMTCSTARSVWRQSSRGPPPRPAGFVRATTLMGFSAAVLLDRQGRAVALAPDNPEMHGVEIAKQVSAFVGAALGGERAVSDIVLSAVTSEPIVAFALPLSDGPFSASWSSGFDLEEGPLKAFLSRQPIAGTRGYIVDSTGVVIVSADRLRAQRKPPRPSPIVRSVGDGWTRCRIVARDRSAVDLRAGRPVAALLAPISSSRTSEWALLGERAALTLAGLMVAAAALTSRGHARGAAARRTDVSD